MQSGQLNHAGEFAVAQAAAAQRGGGRVPVFQGGAAAGGRVPEDVGCATLYWKEDRSYLSGFYQNHEHIGAGAVDLVASQLYHNERGLPSEQKTMLVEAVWKPGKTLVRRTPAGTHSPLRVWTR